MGRLYPTPSDEAADAWRRFAARHGVSYTGLIEALAGELRRLESAPGQMTGFWQQMIDEARAHDAESRSRETPT